VTDKYSLTIPIPPKSKGRPRAGRGGHFYTDKKTREYEDAVKQFYIDAQGPKFDGLIEVELTFKKNSITISIMEIKNESKLKGDADNLAKAVLDALNTVAYDDDRQVNNLKVYKR